MDEIKNLLNKVGKIKKHNDEILDATGARFNVFGLCGVAHYELMHSRILGEFLNPKGSHGLKNAFLDEFIETLNLLPNNEEVVALDKEKAKLFLEYYTPEGRIDILIEDGENALIIENKLYAQDQSQQLSRYDDFAKKNGYKYSIIYLTLDGCDASAQSCTSNDKKLVEYIKISYKDTIINWLENCLKHAVKYPYVRETIAQYINHLKTLTHQDMNDKNKEEVCKELEENLVAAKAIYENYGAVFTKIAKEKFMTKIQEYCEKNNMQCKFDSAAEEYICFSVFGGVLPQDLKIYYWYDKTSKYYYGLYTTNRALYDKIFNYVQLEKAKPIDGAKDKDAKSNENETFIKRGTSGGNYPIWFNLESLTIDDWNELKAESKRFASQCIEQIQFLIKIAQKALKNE
ncbi:PD-(D/E)XK nuclease family protein [Ornithobacterium rhinotracheale]|uniref:PD-(D/E)XK nuclease superfamily protein n=2 Tax=Ornithobacterium rhinotracheale TaxID=28251 RepID=I4A1I5_ORNRL|nr:PD-(D/E)XK nuclease family protein [Ornithobacterium rhinotracheale]AFL97819.1 hypothetical protein Ornrh_1662 [Ornithobacterium rhinotracheale DSM 15997]AIP99646.1 hypothetical protein Q785_08155 [Ornithobacterium rhinotracheale ORT-UMN 88]KGB66175.1 hypothetical protein Q787_07965 [Ornithobacterium rhinotracheale H06-030791]MCK0193885.1 PD-(D/E)XK nuclease family protein [Ornithobacterium rhinotracheale]MCK0200196.1 PD-(D/E)XK nuclease family protein [Ornithobacterium rhinotracheale]